MVGIVGDVANLSHKLRTKRFTYAPHGKHGFVFRKRWSESVHFMPDPFNMDSGWLELFNTYRILPQRGPVVKSITSNLFRVGRIGFDFSEGVVTKVLDQVRIDGADSFSLNLLSNTLPILLICSLLLLIIIWIYTWASAQVSSRLGCYRSQAVSREEIEKPVSHKYPGSYSAK